MTLTHEMHVKMAKKIAQLTKVSFFCFIIRKEKKRRIFEFCDEKF